MKVKTFEELIAWQKAMELVEVVKKNEKIVHFFLKTQMTPLTRDVEI